MPKLEPTDSLKPMIAKLRHKLREIPAEPYRFGQNPFAELFDIPNDETAVAVVAPRDDCIGRVIIHNFIQVGEE